ncbi:GAF and ANTAR domain-containing protein [Actinopolymorpha pittospori]
MAENGGNELFASLQSLLVGLPDLESYLGRVTWMAATTVDPPAWAGITSHFGGCWVTVSASDDRARLADQQQYINGEGPSLEAMRSGAVVNVSDDEAAMRWRLFHRHVLEAGIHSMLAIPLQGVDRRSVGTLNLYSERPNAFAAADMERAGSCARDAMRALAQWIRTAGGAEVAEGLEQAITTRAIIEEAIGILMGQHRCVAPKAFGQLRDWSGNDARRLREVAVDVISEATGSPPVLEAPFGLRGSRDPS